jgi:hypothetical protein
MSKVGGTTWQATISVPDSWSTGQITYWVQAKDSQNNVSQPKYPSASYTLNKGDCLT